MSWDVMVFKFDGPPIPLDKMDRDFHPPVIGSSSEIREKSLAFLPEVDWSNPKWGIYGGQGFSFEFNIGEETQTEGFMVHVRGSGDAITKLIQFAKPNGWSLLDCPTSEFINFEHPSDRGWKGFQDYRDTFVTDKKWQESNG